MEKEILSMEEAAELFNVSVKTFIKLLREENVPARKIGREWRFSRTALINWLSSGGSQSYTSSENDSKQYFNTVALEWEEISKNYYDDSIIKKLKDLNIINSNSIVLDFGCGDGYISRGIANTVKKVVAVDISDEMLKQLQNKVALQAIDNIETKLCDLDEIPVKDNSIDVVCASMILHHIENPRLVVKEFKRVLKNGGWVFLADFSLYDDVEMKEKMHDVWMGFDTSEIEACFKREGFNNILVEVLKNEQGQQKDIFYLVAKSE